TPHLLVNISYFSPFSERKIDIDFIELKNGKFFLKEYRDSSNISFIIKYFSSGSVDADTIKKVGKPFDINFDYINLQNLDLRYINAHLKNFSAEIKGMDIKNYLFKAQINKLTFREKSGFYLRNLTATTTIDTNHITLENMLLETPKTTLRDFYSMKYSSFRDF